MTQNARRRYEAPKNVTDACGELGRLYADIGNKDADRRDAKEMNNSLGKYLRGAMMFIETARQNKTKATSPILK